MADSAPQTPAAAAIPQARQYTGMNWLGLRTLLEREVRRFIKVSAQTLIAPLITTILYISVFALAMGGRGAPIGGIPYIEFLAPGLIMMGVINNAFQNASSSLIIAKVQGNSVDFLMPPLSALELTIAFIGGAAARGIIVGLASLVAVAPFADVTPDHWWAVLLFIVAASVIFGAMELLGGIWADKFDHMAAVQNFVIMPLTMLSGTFYPIGRLPEPFVTISHFNPFFQMIDGFRYGFTGHAESDLWFGGLMSLAITLALCVVCWRWLKAGYKLKA